MEETKSNFSDVINKFNSILREKNIDIGSILDDDKTGSSPLDFDFDLDTIIKFKNIYQKINDNNNPRNRLLYSLKPFLKDKHKEKLDEYIRIANLLSIIELINNDNFRKE